MIQTRLAFSVTWLALLSSLAQSCAQPLPPIALPKPQTDGGKPLMQALRDRRTIREFSPDRLSPQLISNLLWAGFGVNRPEIAHRTAPSAMNAQEVDIYVASEDGLYVYDATANQLQPVQAADLRDKTSGQEFAKQAPITLIFVADYARMAKAKAEQKEFYAGIDTGYISQNIYLFCASEGLATVVHDLDRTALGQAMALRPDQKIVLAQAVGFPGSQDPWTVDFRYRPSSWQTSICLPDDWQKTLVGKDGALLYDYPGKFGGFGTKITAGLLIPAGWVQQDLASPRVPIVRTTLRSGAVELFQEAFAVAAPVSVTRTDPTPSDLPNRQPPRHDLVIVRLRNTGSSLTSAVPMVTIESESPLIVDSDHRHVQIGASTTFASGQVFDRADQTEAKTLLVFPEQLLAPGEVRQFTFSVAHRRNGGDLPSDFTQVEGARQEAEHFWQTVDLPYDHLQVPDSGIQALLDSSVRNIYQAREIKKGLPAFQVGPTCYRGLWVVDGSFLLEAITYLGRTNETRNGVKYLLGFQREDGGIMLIDGHWKETGIALWAVTRHARLTGDQVWLREIWPKVERGFAYILVMRGLASADPTAPNYGLIPDGFSDGGLADKVPEYTNIYWTLAGMRAAIDAAHWLGNTSQAGDWQRQYDDFYAAFGRAAARDLRADSEGNRYLPIRMAKGEGIAPQKAQWAFLHSVFPGRLYAPDDPLVQGNMAMLRAVEKEGLVLDTGWLKDGIWNYFASFYGHAWLWRGDGDQAARTLYAFGNHASPLLVWREEQMPVGKGDEVVGDMPHNWASAEFIRLVRHSLVLERGNELHLFEALPAKWVRPGAITRVKDVLTEFGPISLELRVSQEGASAELDFAPPTRSTPDRIVLHLGTWSGQKGTVDLPVNGSVQRQIRLARPR